MKKLCTLFSVLALVLLCAILLPTQAQAVEVDNGTLEDHINEDNDDYCDLCGSYMGHEHTFDEEYYYGTENGHYVRCDQCSFFLHGTPENHINEDNDDYCDLCDYYVGHEHTFDEEYYYGTENGHYVRCDQCSHYNKATFAEHVNEFGDHYCDICEYCVAYDHVYSGYYFACEKAGHYVRCDLCPEYDESTFTDHLDEDNDYYCDQCGHYLNTFRIVLTWGSVPSDLDSHLIYNGCGGSAEVAFYNKACYGANGELIADLDYDDVTSYGPETVTIYTYNPGESFRYYVYDYSNGGNSNANALANSGAMVKVYRSDKLIATYFVPTNIHGYIWEVFSYSDDGLSTLEHHYTETRVDATDCGEFGYYEYNCTTCDDSYRVYDEEPLDHTAGATVIENETKPNCENEGSHDEVTYCTNCGEELSRNTNTVPALGHAYGEWTEWSAPSCTVIGQEYRVCSVCSDEEARDIDALGHKWDAAWTVDSEVTCTIDGSKSHHCARCDAKTDITVITAPGHSYSAVITPPTCTQQGYTTYTCTVCGKVLASQEVIPPIDHNYIDGICSNCGGIDPTIPDDSDFVIEDGVLVKYVGVGGNVDIPYGVTIIGDYVFYNCTSLTSISIPDSVKTIGKYAFYGCYNLPNITIPDSVTGIGIYAFSSCYSLNKVYYGGTEAQRDAIAIGDYNEQLLSATWQYKEAATTITAQPQDAELALDEYATFTVAVSNSNVTYQWQYKGANSDKWLASIAKDAKTPELRIQMKAYRAGQQYRCVITTADGEVLYSDVATMTLQAPSVELKGQSRNVEANLGDEVSFSVEATGDCLTYQWYYRFGGGNWLKSYTEGYNTATLKTKLLAYRDGYEYKCVVTDASGSTVESTPASMTIKKAAVTINRQPQNVLNGVLNQAYTFQVEAEGENLTYQWEYSADGGATWTKSGQTGCTTNKIEVKLLAYRDGQMYRCVITSGQSKVTSAAAKLKLLNLKIQSQPQSYTGALNDNVTFTVVATGDELTYQWYYRFDGGAWLKSSGEGYNTATLKTKLLAYRDGYEYKCVITDEDGNVIETNPASMTVEKAAITIVNQPQSVTNGVLNTTYTFQVEADGENLTYQWEYSRDGGVTWEKSWSTGYSTNALQIPMKPYRDGQLFRCRITSGTAVVTTDVAILRLA